MLNFGEIVLVPFPFTDLSKSKRRPALIVSANNDQRNDIVVCFITSQTPQGGKFAPVEDNNTTGLKLPSFVRFEKIATLHKKLIVGRLGNINTDFVSQHATTFFKVFGFSLPLK